MTKIVLIGTDHFIQTGSIQTNFSDYVEELIIKHGVEAIAEEIHKPSIPFKIADELKLVYLCIEPSPEERHALGIQSLSEIKYSILMDFEDEKTSEEEAEFEVRKQMAYRAREDEWLKRINTLRASTVLVICGASHFEPFASLLKDNDYEVIKECALWEKKI